jgi:hypothetical protein
MNKTPLAHCAQGGGMLRALAIARRRLLKPGGLVLPDVASLHVAGVDDRDFLVDAKDTWAGLKTGGVCARWVCARWGVWGGGTCVTVCGCLGGVRNACREEAARHLPWPPQAAGPPGRPHEVGRSPR